jgi:NAD-dependent DNA ligase
MTDIRQQISQLTERLHYLNHRYYQDSVSEVSDAERSEERRVGKECATLCR